MHDDRHLPDPDDHPNADVVIYDHSCRICRTTVAWLNRLDGRDRVAYLPLQDERVGRRYEDLSRSELEKHVYVIDVKGQRWSGAAAVRRLSRKIPALWPLVPLLHLPGSMPIWNWLYKQISRRRHMFNR